MRRLIIVVVVLLFILILVAFLLGKASAAPPTQLSVSVVPGSVDRYDSYSVVVLDAPNSTFVLDVYGANGFHFSLENATDAAGVWRTNLQAWYDFGSYSFLAKAGNDTAQSTLSVICDARCQVGILQDGNVRQQALLYGVATQYGVYALLIILALEVPRTVAYFSRAAKDAKQHGRYSAGGLVAAPFARLRGHINPGDQVADPANVQNPRIAADLERRRLMEQLHDATAHAFLEWRPGHIQNLKDIFTDLTSAWGRQASIQPDAMPYAREYARPRSAAAANGGDDMDNLGSWLRREKEGVNERQALKSAPRAAVRAAVYLVGLLGLVMSTLVIAAYVGVYVDPLRPLWMSFPPDWLKVGLGCAAFGAAWGLYLKWRVRVPRKA